MVPNSKHTFPKTSIRGKKRLDRSPLFFKIKRFFALRHLFPWLVTALIVLAGAALPAGAQSTVPAGDSTPEQAWHLTADKFRYDRELDQYTGEGHVVISKQNLQLTADRVQLNQKTMEVIAEGNVRMTTGTDVATGSRLEMDLDSEVGTIYESTLFIKANHFYLQGARIEKVGRDIYTANQVSITTCSGPSPDWKITGRNLKVTVEGYGTLKHAALWAKRMPVGYLPYFFFPAKKKRQSGFLTPEFGSSQRKGSEYIQPWFWAINENSDATFYAHYLEKRGVKYGGEYRYVLDEPSKGSMMFDFLDDRKIDDGQNNSSDDYGYQDDNVLRPNSDRYWFRMKADQALGHDFNAKLDLDVVSDQDYLHDFKRGYTGFRETNAYFEKEFGRSLDDYDDSNRVNRLNISRIWQQFSLNTELRWYDDVIKRRQADEDTTLQQLPLIGFDAARQKLMETPFFYNLESVYKYYYRQDENSLFMGGHMLNVNPRIFLPLRYKNYFSFEPSLGFRETLWHIDNNDAGISAGFDWENEESFMHREIYDLKLDLSTDLHKVYAINTSSGDKIKHIIKPQIIYNYVPRVDQDDYPRFESIEEDENGNITIDDNLSTIDRIEDRNRITYAITNSLTTKTREPSSSHQANAAGGAPPLPDYNYRRLVWFKLQQSYIFDESDVDDDEPFSEILAELELYPTSHVALEANAEWHPYEDDFATRNIALRLTDNQGDRFYIEHRYSRNLDKSKMETIRTTSGTTITITDSDTDTFEDSESIYANLYCSLTERIAGYCEYERNLRDDSTVLALIGFQYKSQCWSLNLTFSEEYDDSKIAFMINLQGLGELGSEFSGFEL